jgi:chromosome segregation ATPase
MKVWDGCSRTRDTERIFRAPDGRDWWTITDELQKTQTFLKNLAENASAMPNLPALIAARQEELQALQQDIEAITPPVELTERVTALEASMASLQSACTDIEETTTLVNALAGEMPALILSIQSHIESCTYRESQFEARLSEAKYHRIVDVDEKVEALETIVETLCLANGIDPPAAK